jgi:hypothetical protein
VVLHGTLAHRAGNRIEVYGGGLSVELLPILRTAVSRLKRSSSSGLRLVKSLIRVARARQACWNARSRSTSVAATAAGSSTPQCAVIGWPGHAGHVSFAALLQTVKTKPNATVKAHARRFGRDAFSVFVGSGTDRTCRSAASCSGMIR